MKNEREPEPSQEHRKDLIRRHYEPRIGGDLPHHQVLDWASAQSQLARFEIFARNIPLQDKSLLDVGCGLGDLLTYLDSLGLRVRYTGVDLLEKMVQAARRNHPGIDFVQGDIFQTNPFKPENFDVVFCSGAFNLNLGNNEQFLPIAVATMLEMAREHAVFNLLHSRAASQEQTYFYYHPDQVQEMLRDCPCQIRIIDDYLHNDFTVICKKGIANRE
jgi:SAM-dependent methyltransferase